MGYQNPHSFNIVKDMSETKTYHLSFRTNFNDAEYLHFIK